MSLTQNVTITSDWTKVADAADDPVLVTSNTKAPVEFAVKDTGGDPTVEAGHRLGDMAEGAGVTRLLLGEGDIYARIMGSEPASALLVVTK